MYEGDVNPQEAFDQLNADPKAILIDVRTRAEWAFVGVPAVERMATICWQSFPSMHVNEEFVSSVAEAGIPKDAPIYLLCRSGGRSAAAAAALTEAGYASCYNVAEGFEGDLDPARHRGTQSGWKARGLPWVQS
jgi:rhodanese-related sulfurtransferase